MKKVGKTLEDFSKKNLIQIDREFRNLPGEVVLTGKTLTLQEIIAVARYNAPVKFTQNKQILDRIRTCYETMIKDVRAGIPIYGCNTGYGARASRVLTDGTPDQRIELAKMISEGIAHIDVSVGPLFDKEIIRGAMLIRINMLMQGVSAVKIEDLEIYRQMLNNQITPLVSQYGGIGASGDLAHNCRVLSAARQLSGVKVWDKNGVIKEAKEALTEAGIPALKLDPKAGLGLVNGDNFSTSLATILAVDTLQALLVSCITGAMSIEVLRGSNRSFHTLLSDVRPHPGQKQVASIYRYLLDASKLIYQEMDGHKIKPKGVNVQDAYSLRCLSQYHAPNFEKILSIFSTITINANSVSDNPLWVSPEFASPGEKPWQWVSGGNFLAMHMAESMDGLRKTMTQIVKLNDRHLARMVNPDENNGLPANLSDRKAPTQCVFKGVQIQSGMFEVYSTLLSIPVTTFFGVHEEMNQDVTSHALTSGILGLENLKLVRYSIAQNLLAITQAVDLLGGPNNLSVKTKPIYELVRSKTVYVEKERPLNNDIEAVYQSLISGELISLMREQVFNEFTN